MPSKIHPRGPTDTVRIRGRLNTVTTVASKASASAVDRTSLDQLRINSGATRTNSGTTSIIVANHPQDFYNSEQNKIITEVDDTNIDEVLNLNDLSLIPTSFLTEIQQDKVYETILAELQKKIAHQFPPGNFLTEQNQQRKQFSPRLLAINDGNDDDDDDISITDAASSSTESTGNNEPLAEEDYDTDIECETVVKDIHDITGREQYRELCEEFKTIPCSYFMAHIQDNEMILRYHQFSTDDIRAITKTLSNNITVERLLLDGNYLQQQAAKYITQLLTTNDCITELSLTDNRLGGGDEGTKELCKMLTLNKNLKKINLSGNNFNELDIQQLIEAFEQNKIIRELDLSHNNFGEKCGKALGTYLSSNYILESIDLSWNNFRGRSAIELVQGIKDNPQLKRCNLERNGFGPEGGPILAECIKQNKALEELNINANRLNTPNAFSIAQALSTNEALQVLKMADNQINSDGVLAVFLCIKANQANSLREVDFSRTVVTEETANVCKDIVQLKDGNFQYHIGSITPNKLQPNSMSECYVKTNEELLKKFRSNAASVKPNTN